MLTPDGAAAAGSPTCRSLLRGRRGRRQLEFTFNFGDERLERPARPSPTRSDEITAIDGVEVYLGGFGGQAADSVEAFSGFDTTLLLITLLASSS